MGILKDITIIVDKKYAQSYGGKTTESYPYGQVEGKYLTLFDDFGRKIVRKDTTGKHFHSYTSKKVITDSIFKKETDLAMKKFKVKSEAFF